MTASQKRVKKATDAVRLFVTQAKRNSECLLEDPQEVHEDMIDNLRDMLIDMADMKKCDLDTFRFIIEEWDEQFYVAVEKSQQP